ncbi:hypothetical protein L3X38_003769 [Prunus dulcis]|uniref:Reverse transcriptase n=1 Tax=Prunus dulcis TaxID=3755 RepID=A0AAD4ZMM8_PRUDU|nr:hypothetical protein L3X38_003769 [Prunus dulcis]
MNVAPRRRPKAHVKCDGKREYGAKPKGSRFDALRMVSENFGRDDGETSLEGNKGSINANDAAQFSFSHGNKIWTKPKNTKSGARQALSDISNETTKGTNAGEGSIMKAYLPSQAKYGSFPRARTEIVDGKKGFIAWKIDLSKAYDRLNWNFIEYVLVELRLPDDLVHLIKSCVTTVNIQAVTTSIPIYAMQTTKLPASVCDDLDKLNRNFFWGAAAREGWGGGGCGEKKQKIHSCQWDLVCRPTWKVGMGLKKTTAMNQAMLAKIGWRLRSKDKGLWAKIYETNYMQGSTILDTSLKSKQGCSSTWRSILHGTALLSQGLAWRIGKGDSTHLWTNKWVSDAPLAHLEGVLQLTD